MAADFFLGESLVGDGNEVAHIDLIIGSKSGHAGAAFANALANNKDGFTTLLAVGFVLTLLVRPLRTSREPAAAPSFGTRTAVGS